MEIIRELFQIIMHCKREVKMEEKIVVKTEEKIVSREERRGEESRGEK